MRTRTLIVFSLVSAIMFCFSSVGLANIWMDENFDGTSILVQGDGGGTSVSPANATLDIYSYNTLASQISSVLTQTGAKVTSKYLDGTACYQIETGETLAVGTPYQDPRNGNFVLFQFGVNVDPIPSAGDVGILRFNWDTDDTAGASPDYSFYVKLVSTGSVVTIIAGEDVHNSPASEATIGTLSSTSDWKFITMSMQNSGGSQSYTHANLPGGSLSQNEGVDFYCSSTSSGHTVAMSANGVNKTGLGWAVTVSSGTVYIDSVYWEGGMDGDNANGAINIRAFDYAGSTSVIDWSLY
jgi:hypothetical protein